MKFISEGCFWKPRHGTLIGQKNDLAHCKEKRDIGPKRDSIFNIQLWYWMTKVQIKGRVCTLKKIFDQFSSS